MMTQKKKDLKDNIRLQTLRSMMLCALILLYTLQEGQ